MDYLEAAKARIAEIEGEHPIQIVDSTMLVAIADALVAIAESMQGDERTCHMETEESCQNWMSCSECHADYYNDQPINYCPNCGAKVVEA